jgi:hypothetical protein
VPDYVLTKTHCASYSDHSSPEEYIVDSNAFYNGCASGFGIRDDGQTQLTRYQSTTVPVKAVHLIRNPFDNMVARMHMRTKEERDGKYTNDKAGFDAWCVAMDQQWKSIEAEYFSESILELFEKVPCYHDWYRYVQWHNNANEVIRERHLPDLVLWYEDYSTNFNRTVDSLFAFLNLEKKGKPRKFVAGKEYSSYYSEEVALAANRLVRALATPQTWDQIKHYFEHH